MITVIYEHNHIWVRADYSGGPYIDLTFSRSPDIRSVPSEVINVWDYETSKPSIAPTLAGVAIAVQGWMDTNEEDGWDTWAEDYLTNAR